MAQMNAEIREYKEACGLRYIDPQDPEYRSILDRDPRQEGNDIAREKLMPTMYVAIPFLFMVFLFGGLGVGYTLVTSLLLGFAFFKVPSASLIVGIAAIWLGWGVGRAVA